MKARRDWRGLPGDGETMNQQLSGMVAFAFAVAGAALAGPGCTPQPQSTSISDAFQRRNGPPADAAASPGSGAAAAGGDETAPGGDAIAVVNGRPIGREWLTRALIQTHGLELLVLKVSLELVREEADARGLAITAADIDREYDLTLQVAESGGGEVTPQRRQQLIDRWLLARGVSAEELRLAMQRQALLRKLAGQRIKLDETTIRDEFARMYGAKVQIRHIELASQRDVDRIKPYVDAGEDFARLAQQYSTNEVSASKGGLLPPFTRHDETIPGALRQAAYALSPGQLSNPIKVENRYHLIKLERIIEPTVIRFEDVRPAVEASLRNRVLQPEMERLLSELQQRAKLTIHDDVLRAQYADGIKRGRINGAAPR